MTPAALEAFDRKFCGPIGQVVLRNRGAGPFGLLNMVDERCGGTFKNIDDVIPREGTRRVHGGLQGCSGLCDRESQQSAANNPEWRARSALRMMRHLTD